MGGDAAAQTGLAWGIMGLAHEVQILSDGVRGIVRTVNIGLAYNSPPLPAGQPVWHPSPQNAATSFEMPWSGDPMQAKCLMRLAAGLAEQARAEHWESIPCDGQVPRELRWLDKVVNQLLGIVVHLHQRNHGVGLLTPEGVLVSEGPEATVALPDIGFTWHTEGMPVVPSFLDPNGSYAPLWGLGPEMQLDRGREVGGSEPFDPCPDVQVLGRVLASALLGRIIGKIPSPQECPQTVSQTNAVPDGRRIWETLQDAVAGRITSVDGPDGLAARLDATPLSQHYMGDKLPTTGPEGITKWAIMVVVAVLVLLGGITAWKWDSIVSSLPWNVDPPRETEVPKPEEGGSEVNIPQPETPTGSTTVSDSEYFKGWRVRVRNKSEEWGKYPLEGPKIVNELKALRDELKNETKNLSDEPLRKERDQCLAYVELLMEKL